MDIEVRRRSIIGLILTMHALRFRGAVLSKVHSEIAKGTLYTLVYVICCPVENFAD